MAIDFMEYKWNENKYEGNAYASYSAEIVPAVGIGYDVVIRNEYGREIARAGEGNEYLARQRAERVVHEYES